MSGTQEPEQGGIVGSGPKTISFSSKEFVPGAKHVNVNGNFDLIEGDDALGMSSGANDIAAQATALLQAAQPFGVAPSERGVKSHTRSLGAEYERTTFPHQSTIAHQVSFPHQAAGVPPVGGGGRMQSGKGSAERRGRGRGRRGGGHQQYHQQQGPGLHRPSVSAFMVSQGVRRLIGQFASETFVQTMQQHNYLSTSSLDDDIRIQYSIPETVQLYHSLCPLENLPPSLQQPSRVYQLPTLMMRGIHTGDGASYALRRIDGRSMVPTSEIVDLAKHVVAKWVRLCNHPNIVGLRDVFVSEEMFDTPSLYLSFDYYPAACTLEQLHMLPSQGGNRQAATEADLWSYLVQLTSVLRAVHGAGLDIGPPALSPSKIILCFPKRIRLGSIGVSEIVTSTPSTDAMIGQLLDLAAVGSLILNLGCAAKNVPPSLESMVMYFSPELCHVIAGLIAAPKGNGFKTWKNLAAALGDKVFDDMDSSMTNIDTLIVDMMKECENGRIARFLIKLNTVVDRAELLGDDRWAETGDRYLLKLFRDFIFHQVDENGLPMNDWGIIIESINKADAGVHEKIMLLSRDEASMLVVSYADIKKCLDTAYDEIKRNSSP